jgi:hypothetical protein
MVVKRSNKVSYLDEYDVVAAVVIEKQNTFISI